MGFDYCDMPGEKIENLVVVGLGCARVTGFVVNSRDAVLWFAPFSSRAKAG